MVGVGNREVSQEVLMGATNSAFAGKTALVTGASSGIGVELARELARRGANLVLVARRVDRLEALAVEISALGVTAKVAPCDVADFSARVALAEAHPEVDILVNNAGLGVYGLFKDLEWERTSNMLEVNIVGLTHLTKLFSQNMILRGYGRVLMVASTAAFQPVPIFAAYAASKAYVLSLSEALNVEFENSGVQVTALCPGATESEFFEVAKQTKSMFVRKAMMSSAAAAKVGVDALAAGRSSAVAGLANGLMAFGTRLTPRSVAAKLGFVMMKAG
jgi:short-subunit dehydrogenase